MWNVTFLKFKKNSRVLNNKQAKLPRQPKFYEPSRDEGLTSGQGLVEEEGSKVQDCFRFLTIVVDVVVDVRPLPCSRPKKTARCQIFNFNQSDRNLNQSLIFF